MTLLQYFELLAYAAAILGIPSAIFAYVREKRRERLEREYGTYNALDEKYIEYLRWVVEHPRLDLYYLPLEQPVVLTPEEKIQQYAMFETLVSLLERAFLMYRDQSNRIKQKQWAGWNDYMEDWCKRDNFRALWEILGVQFDGDFEKHMRALMEKHRQQEDIKSHGDNH
ncbi:MAG: hypothetical protein L0Z70_16675 [Chloroflexi bacterium]|nr:hypothetical protein [Chloroflexota bacterium]